VRTAEQSNIYISDSVISSAVCTSIASFPTTSDSTTGSDNNSNGSAIAPTAINSMLCFLHCDLSQLEARGIISGTATSSSAATVNAESGWISYSVLNHMVAVDQCVLPPHFHGSNNSSNSINSNSNSSNRRNAMEVESSADKEGDDSIEV
jgi:hypothetical protein